MYTKNFMTKIFYKRNLRREKNSLTEPPLKTTNSFQGKKKKNSKLSLSQYKWDYKWTHFHDKTPPCSICWLQNLSPSRLARRHRNPDLILPWHMDFIVGVLLLRGVELRLMGLLRIPLEGLSSINSKRWRRTSRISSSLFGSGDPRREEFTLSIIGGSDPEDSSSEYEESSFESTSLTVGLNLVNLSNDLRTEVITESKTCLVARREFSGGEPSDESELPSTFNGAR